MSAGKPLNNRGSIILIGAGKLANVVGRALRKNGVPVEQVYSRTASSAKELAAKLRCRWTNSLKNISQHADLYVIAVKDDAIIEVASVLKLKGKTVVHTSGSVPMTVLKGISDEYGVLYPVHGFEKNELMPAEVPFCIEYSNPAVKRKLDFAVKKLSGAKYYMNSRQRAMLHLAAVFANNFSNHLWANAEEILKKAHIPREIIVQLVEDSVEKLRRENPALHQTGPAARKDTRVLKMHEQMLRNDFPDLLPIYNLLSKSIGKKGKTGSK